MLRSRHPHVAVDPVLGLTMLSLRSRLTHGCLGSEVAGRCARGLRVELALGQVEWALVRGGQCARVVISFVECSDALVVVLIR